MCIDPATMALIATGVGAAASLGGTAIQASNQASYARDLNRAQQEKEAASLAAQRAEQARQKQFADQAMANFDKTLADRGPQNFQADADAGKNAVLATTEKVAESNTPGLAEGMLPGQTGPSVSPVFTAEVARQGATRAAEAKERINALATLAGYDRANGMSRITGNRFRADQGLWSGIASRSLALGKQEGDVATPYVEQPDSGLAKALSGAGNLALQYGSYKGNVNPDALKTLQGTSGSSGGAFSSIFG